MKRILIILFVILYAAVALVSLYHAIAFFMLSNPEWLATILAVTFEIGQAAVLFTILYNTKSKNVMAWGLMGILTVVQVLGNVFSSYKFMIINNADQIRYFTKSVLFFVQSPNPEYNYVMISYITGAILPIVALCMTGMVVKLIKGDSVGVMKEIPESTKKDTETIEIETKTTENPDKTTTKETENEWVDDVMKRIESGEIMEQLKETEKDRKSVMHF